MGIVDLPAARRTRTPAEHQLRESRFMLVAIGGIIVSASMLRLVALRLIGLSAIPASVCSWALTVGTFGYMVARRREGATVGEAIVLAAAMSAVGAVAGCVAGVM